LSEGSVLTVGRWCVIQTGRLSMQNNPTQADWDSGTPVATETITQAQWEAAAPVQEHETTASSMGQQFAAGMAPPLVGATAGALVAGVPGALAGSVAVPLGDLVGTIINAGTSRLNSVLNKDWQIPQLGMPSEALTSLMGFPEAKTQAERVSRAAGGAVTSAATQLPSLARLATTAATPIGRGIAQTMSQSPRTQLAIAPVAGGAAQYAGEEYGPVAALAAPLAVGMLPASWQAARAVVRPFQKAGVGAAISPVDKLRIAADVSQAVKGVADEAGIPVQAVDKNLAQFLQNEAEKAFVAGKVLDIRALMRESQFHALGIKPMQGQLTRDPTQFAREINLRGISPEIAARLNEQNIRLHDILGAPTVGATDPYKAGMSIIQVLSKKDEAMRRLVSRKYTTARASAEADLDLPMQGLAQDFTMVMDEFAGKVPQGVINQFEKYGLTGMEQKKVYTIMESDKLIKVINANMGNDAATNNALRILRNSVKQSVLEADATGGPFAPALKIAAQRFRELENNPALAAAANRDAIPDDFVRKFIINGKTDDVIALANKLSDNPSAFAQAKAQMAMDIRRAAFGENLAGDAALSPERLAVKLRTLGPDKMGAFFTPQEIERYNLAALVGTYIAKHPNAAPVNTSNTLVAQLMMNPAAQLAAKAADAKLGFAGATLKIMGDAIAREKAVAEALNSTIPAADLPFSEAHRSLLMRVIGEARKGGSAQSLRDVVSTAYAPITTKIMGDKIGPLMRGGMIPLSQFGQYTQQEQ